MTRLAIVTWIGLVFASGCERSRMDPDQQIALLDNCEHARRRCLEASREEREGAITVWVSAVNRANGLCVNDLHDALVSMDDKTHVLALEVTKRIDWRATTISLLSDLETARLSPEQRRRAAATLKALTGQDFGMDRAGWEAWLRSESR